MSLFIYYSCFAFIYLFIIIIIIIHVSFVLIDLFILFYFSLFINLLIN